MEVTKNGHYDLGATEVCISISSDNSGKGLACMAAAKNKAYSSDSIAICRNIYLRNSTRAVTCMEESGVPIETGSSSPSSDEQSPSFRAD
jgi:hypothetical protein